VKTTRLILSLLFLAAFAWPQAAPAPSFLPDQFAAAGLAWNQYAAPQINGWASYAASISKANGVYSFTTYDVTSVTRQPFSVQTSVRTGLALYMRSFGPFHIFGLADVGVAAAGGSVGGSASGGGMIALPLGKGWTLLAPVRVLKTALSDRQLIFELGFGWGK
jgi:hypothetical protein